MSSQWSEAIPATEGWYWMVYTGKRGQQVLCPAQVTHIDDTTLVKSARNDDFVAGPRHGGPQLRYMGGMRIDKTVRFGPEIPPPDLP